MTLANLVYSATASFNSEYKVYPVYAPQEANPPWITYRINQTSEQDELSYQLDGEMNPYWATFYVTVWTKNYNELDALIQPFIGHMYQIRGEGDTGFQRVQFMGREDLALDDLTLFGADLKFRGFTTQI